MWLLIQHHDEIGARSELSHLIYARIFKLWWWLPRSAHVCICKSGVLIKEGKSVGRKAKYLRTKLSLVDQFKVKVFPTTLPSFPPRYQEFEKQ